MTKAPAKRTVRNCHEQAAPTIRLPELVGNANGTRSSALENLRRLVRNDGVRSIDDLRDRCWVDDETGCWHWRGALSNGKNASLWLPQLRRSVSLPLAICVLVTGSVPPKGRVWHRTCETHGCANPEHRTNGTRSSQMLAAKLVRSPLVRARIAAGCRARSSLSDQAVAEIRASDDILRVEAEKHGISLEHVRCIRMGLLRKPLAAPGSSVFNFGG